MKKAVEITINIEIARTMLGVAGFPETHKMTEDMVFSAVLSLIECYGANFDILTDKVKKRKAETWAE